MRKNWRRKSGSVLSALKEAGSIDPMAAANELGASYSIAVEEICALVTKEAEAAGISIIQTKK